MFKLKKVNARHQLYCCPKCHGPAKFVHTKQNAVDLTGVCAACGWVGDDAVAQPTQILAYAEWQRVVGSMPETEGRTPDQLPMSDAAMVDACARLQGWVDYETDSGEGKDTWYLDAERAPRGLTLRKYDFNPLRSGVQAHALADMLGMKLDYDGVLGPTAKARGSNATYEVNLRDGFDFGALVGVQGVPSGVMAMYRAIVTAAARYYQQGLHVEKAK